MGLVDRAFGGSSAIGRITEAAEGLSEVFVPNATRELELASEIHRATLEAAATEFQFAGNTWFDRIINGINRLPRPALALGTLGLFVYAMVDPIGFSERMIGLQEVPEPLWWLLGAVVSFYFGARELHYARATSSPGARGGGLRDRVRGLFNRRENPPTNSHDDNPALREWHRTAR